MRQGGLQGSFGGTQLSSNLYVRIRASVSANPAEVGFSMAEAEQWCVRTQDGDIYQLGAPGARDRVAW
jgi:hypothetical protein